MGKFANAAFYLFTFWTFLCVLIVIFSKEAKYYLSAAIMAFVSIAGIYLSVKSFFMSALEILLFVFILGSLMIYLNKNTCLDEKKNLININPLTIISPVLIALFAILTAPFAIHQIKLQNPSLLTGSEFVSKFIDLFDLNFLIISILVLAALSGFYTIAFWRKK